MELPCNGDRVVPGENETVTLAHARTADFEIGGLRYQKTENRLEWTTSIVSLKTGDRHLLSLQVLCEALGTAVRLPPPKKPYFIRQALSELGGGYDGEIPVADKPFRLSDGEEPIAAALILGIANNTLPIVYVSAGFNDEPLVNPDELALYVGGMAHVIVEPSRSFSLKVKDLTAAKNVYGGTVGVYWPNSTARRSYFVDLQKPNSRAIQLDVAKDIRVALSNRRQRSHCTWAHLQEVIARNRLEQLKSRGSTEVQAYIEAFDAELAAKESRVTEAEQEIARLNAEIRRLSTRSGPGNSEKLIAQGDEQDLYENEVRDILIDAIADACRNARENSRRQHVLMDLLNANPHTGARTRLEEEIKTLFRAYKEMDGRTRSALARMGFDLSEEGKHFKAVFQGDGRYTFTLAKTSSDHRAGKNLASDIINALF